VKKGYKTNRIYNKLGVVRAKQQFNAIKNSADQVDVFQKQFVDDSQKRPYDQTDAATPRKKKVRPQVKLFL